MTSSEEVPRSRRRPGPLNPEPFGRYLLLDRIDVGGMAEVFRGRMSGVEGFERLVALKRILPNIASDPDFVEMFVDEAKLAVQLRHANIAQIYELGLAEGCHFIAMEYVSGVDLRTMWDRARTRSRLLPIAMSCHILQKVCEGLDAAHRKKDDLTGEDIGLVHRDISPQNILVSFEGEVKIIDFGIAKAANKVSKTQAGVLKGKFGYMSPEQVRGIELDNRSDIFACGVVLYELVVGDRLFLGESDFSTLEKVRNVEMVPPTALNKHLSVHLERIVMKALGKNREERYRWASEMAEDLQRYLFATNQPFARTDLQRYMQQHFRPEIEDEKERLERYRAISVPEPVPVEPRTEVGAGALAGPVGGMFDGAPAPGWDSRAPSVVTGRFEDSNFTALAAPALPAPEPIRGRVPGWLAGALGGFAAVLLLGAVAAASFGSGLLSRTGGLLLQLSPADARVFLDDRLVANTSPVTLDGLTAGPHVLTIRAEGYEEAVRPVTVGAGEVRMFAVRLRPVPVGSLALGSQPSGLSVELDGRPTGRVTPAEWDGLSLGSRQVALRHPDGALAHAFTVELTEGEPVSKEVVLAELPVRIEVRTEPAGAEVRINGQLRGRTPLSVAAGLEPGPVRLEVRRPGCQPVRQKVDLRRGRVAELDFDLECDR